MYTDYIASFSFTQPQLSDGSSVKVVATWTLGPLASDEFEVYYAFAPDESLPGPPRLTVLPGDTKPPVTLTVPLLGMPAVLYLWLAPRTLDDDHTPDPDPPDTLGDPHEWYLYAGSDFKAISYMRTVQVPATAVISSITPFPKTLQARNHFEIVCSATGGNVDDFNLIPTENGGELEQLEHKDGHFQQISSPLAHFQFKAQAHNQAGWGPWCAPVNTTAIDNYHSVADFLQASGVNLKPPVLLKQYLTQSKSASMRAMLGI